MTLLICFCRRPKYRKGTLAKITGNHKVLKLMPKEMEKVRTICLWYRLKGMNYKGIIP